MHTTTPQEKATGRRAGFLAGFRRSKRGNLWRHYEGRTLTVFRRDRGGFAWCVADGEEPRFSPLAYGTEREALDALWDWYGEGEL